MIYFISDPHFGHSNVIRYSNRPFSSAEEMDKVLIDNWNSTVKQNDEIYVLGDFSFKDPKNYFNKLNGRKYLIKGNHDRVKDHKDLGWEWIKDYYELKYNNYLFVLMHYSMRTWNKSHYGSFHLFGHSHNTLKGMGRSCDVGVDAQNFKPVSIEEIKERLSKIEIHNKTGD